MATSRILGPDGQPIQYEVLAEEISAPSATGIRQVWHASAANNLTPQRLASILSAANQGDATQYLTLAEEMEERDAHYASVLGTRKLAITGLDIVIESASDDAEDVRRADALRALVSEPSFGELIAHQVDALGKGYAVSEIVWDRSGREWMPTFEDRDPRWFTFDRVTGRELRIIDEVDTFNGVAMPPYKFVAHRPRIRSGLPIRGGLARLAAPSYMCKAWAWKDWMSFADIFGLPMRIGRYGPNASQGDIDKLISAIANLGSDAAAAVPDSVRIELIQAASVGGAGEFFDRLLSFWDKQVSKGVLGQTMTADDGASLSQARVHNDVRIDLLEADAKALSNTLQRHVVEPFCALNFGTDRKPPRIRVAVPTPDTTAALVDALAKLVPVGLTVEQSVVRDRLGLPDPEPGADVLASVPAAMAPSSAALPADAAPVAGPGSTGDVQSEALNGAQVASLLEILDRIAMRRLPVDAGRGAISAAFPLLSQQEIDEMLNPLRTFTPAPAPSTSPALNAQARALPGVVELASDVMASAVDPLVSTWVDVLGEMSEGLPSLAALRTALDERADALSLELIARQVAQGMAVAKLAGRMQIRALLDEELGRAQNADDSPFNVINRGWKPAADFFLRKINVPSQRWDDLWQAEHANAFTVAGAMREDLLADLRAAVDAAINDGESYEQFRARFDEIVARNGWTGWTGEGSEAGVAWRTRVIYTTNLRTSHAAGRYAQMSDPETLQHMPYWMYRHNTVTVHARAAHARLDGLVLLASDPWWDTHYPPNDWGCACDVLPLSERQLKRLGKSGPDKAPGAGPWDPPPEWAYNVGAGR